MSKIFILPSKNVKKAQKKNKIKNIFFILLFILIDLIVVFNLSDIFSSIITHKRGIFFNEKIEFNSFSFYCVSLKHFQNEIDATNFANKISCKGAMGKVYKNGEYYVLANIYPNLIEAQEIKENLIDLGYDARIVKLSSPLISLNYKGKNKSLILDCLNFLKQTPINLCNFSIDFDSKNIKKSTLNGKLACLLEQSSDILGTFSQSKTKNDEKLYKKLQGIFENLDKKIEKVVLLEDNFESCACNLKQTIFEIVLMILDGFSSFN